MFVLVKGNLQGAVKNPKKSANNKNKLCINKKSFLESFREILKATKSTQKIDEDSFTYLEAKQLSTNFNLAADQFYDVYKGWIRTDPNKYYSFN